MSTKGKAQKRKKNCTDLQASLCAVGLLSLPRRLLGTALSTNRLSLSTGHLEKVSRIRVAAI